MNRGTEHTEYTQLQDRLEALLQRLGAGYLTETKEEEEKEEEEEEEEEKEEEEEEEEEKKEEEGDDKTKNNTLVYPGTEGTPRSIYWS